MSRRQDTRQFPNGTRQVGSHRKLQLAPTAEWLPMSPAIDEEREIQKKEAERKP